MKQDSVTRELTTEVVVGFFMVMILLGLAYFTFILSGSVWGEERFEMEVLFGDVMGLKETDSVVVRGMPIGKVSKLVLQEKEKDNKDGILVFLSLKKKLHMKTDNKITIVSTSILGGRYLEIYEGSEDAKDLPEGSPLFGKKPYDLMADAAELVSLTKDGFGGEDGIIESLRGSASQMKELITRLNEGKGTLGKLMSSDDNLYKDLSAAVASLKKMAERLEKGEGTLGKLMSPDDKLYKDLTASVESLKNISSKIEKGEGTIGKLISDEQLYDDLKQTVAEVQAAIDDFRETSPVVTFTSIFFGAF
ncbi:MAG: MCE family protein [Kiritimatiellae bacterium]|nr:MCE family protein [Kiritimatiellia bacterium]